MDATTAIYENSSYNFNQSNVTLAPEPEPFLNASVWKIVLLNEPGIAQLSQLVVLVCVFLIGIVGNLLLICSLPRIPNLNKSLMRFAVSMAICDITMCLMLPYHGYIMMVHDDAIDRLSCIAEGFLITFPGILKNLHMAEMSALCYLMIWHPHRHYKIQKPLSLNLTIITCWVLAVLFSGAAFYWSNPYNGVCDLETLWNIGKYILHCISRNISGGPRGLSQLSR